VAGLTAGWLVGKYRSTSDVPEINQFPRVSWQMQTFLSDSVKNTILFQSPEKVCNLIKKMTGGHFEITLQRTGETEKILEKVSEGKIECGYGGIYYSTAKFKPLFFGCSIPFEMLGKNYLPTIKKFLRLLVMKFIWIR
jgi:TRAP-type mannitol/chloroaromatic compound transport system substrate-binding protein